MTDSPAKRAKEAVLCLIEAADNEDACDVEVAERHNEIDAAIDALAESSGGHRANCLCGYRHEPDPPAPPANKNAVYYTDPLCADSLRRQELAVAEALLLVTGRIVKRDGNPDILKRTDITTRALNERDEARAAVEKLQGERRGD